MNFNTLQSYINTCSENSLNRFYVYELWDPIKDEVVYTADQRKAISLRIRGKGNPMYGRTHTQKAIQIMSSSRRSRPPYRHTQEHREYLKTHCLLAKNAKPICQINFSGNVIATYPSAKKAAEIIGSLSRGNIASCCNQFLYRSASGFFWRYADDPNLINGKLIDIEEMNRKRLRGKVL